jgi:23S rRNA pseudouridine2605 synthase
MTDDVRPEPDQPEPKRDETERLELEGPEADAIAAEEATKAAASDTYEQAIDGLLGGEDRARESSTVERAPEEQADGKLERLQKILAQAGIASRRHAEELITQGRVQVNGKIVTELGTKADAVRDHIRVDGKLLQGSERLRYFMLNKPKGFVTTVSDPEGRPTIMEFFSKMRERLYPVGRLDYLSEGLLLVTNDGELANKLTRAAAGVEKTYLVKVSGQPSIEDIDRLREGVGIDRGRPGSERVQTAPAEIRRVRQGDNPWYEVVLIEGRNRELRKMFEEIGHHVEKIRRVGYGPLVLDLEPGKVRELDPEEVENLRKAAEGKYRKPKARQSQKRGAHPEAKQRDARPIWKQRGDEGGKDRRQYGRPDRSGTGAPRRAEQGEFRRGESTGTSRPERGQFRRPERDSSSPRPERGEFPRRPSEGRQRPERSEFGQRPGSGRRGEAQRPERREFRGRGGDEFRSKPRFEQARPTRPPRREASDSSGARPDRFQRSAGRGSVGARPATGRGSRPEYRPEYRPATGPKTGQGSRPQRFDKRRSNFEGAGSGARPRFGSKQGPQLEREREQPKERGPRFDRERDREQRPNFERRSPGGPERKPQGRREGSDRGSSAGRPGRFNRSGPGARGKGSGSKPGSVRSGGGRRPGFRPGGKPGGKPPGGKRRG